MVRAIFVSRSRFLTNFRGKTPIRRLHRHERVLTTIFYFNVFGFFCGITGESFLQIRNQENENKIATLALQIRNQENEKIVTLSTTLSWRCRRPFPKNFVP